MGVSNSRNFQLNAWELNMIEISWSFVNDKQDLGVKTMIRYRILPRLKLLLSNFYLLFTS